MEVDLVMKKFVNKISLACIGIAVAIDYLLFTIAKP